MMKISNQAKFLLILICLAVSVAGFMMKLPAIFQHFDKELHALFYFSAAAFLNLLFANKNVIRHAIIFIALYCFSVAIEYAQEYSNKFFHKRIHGRYDVEDIHANLKGLVLFSIVWIVWVAILFVSGKVKREEALNSR